MSATPDRQEGAAVTVKERDLPAFCPNPAMPLWSSHPRVFLDIARTGTASCPYCGTHYRLEGGALSAGH
ncbi:MAG: zinc-finger domain-containing protein [Burkholderiales bacterium]